MKTKNKVSGKVIIYILLVFFALVFLLPIVWIVFSSFKTAGELFAWPPSLLGEHPTVDNYLLALEEGDFVQYFVNTVFVSIVATILTVIVNVMAGYVFAKYDFRFKKLLFALVMATLMIPLEVIMIPVFKVIVATHMYNSLWGLIIPAVASPTAVFLVRQYYVPIPTELMEAARIDGAGEFRIFFRIVMPAVKPAIMTLVIFTFQSMWNATGVQYVYSEQLKMLPSVLQTLAAGGIARTGAGSAVGVILMIPPILVFIISQSSVMETMSHSGLK